MDRGALIQAAAARFRTAQGPLLQRARLAAGKTTAQVAAEVGTAQSQLSRWERGAQLIRVDWMVRLARAYGVGPATLLPPAETMDEPTEDQTDGSDERTEPS